MYDFYKITNPKILILLCEYKFCDSVNLSDTDMVYHWGFKIYTTLRLAQRHHPQSHQFHRATHDRRRPRIWSAGPDHNWWFIIKLLGLERDESIGYVSMLILQVQPEIVADTVTFQRKSPTLVMNMRMCVELSEQTFKVMNSYDNHAPRMLRTSRRALICNLSLYCDDKAFYWGPDSLNCFAFWWCILANWIYVTIVDRLCQDRFSLEDFF